MRLATIREDGSPVLAVVDPAMSKITVLGRAAPDLPEDMNAFIALGPEGLVRAAEAVAAADESAVIAAKDATFLSPIPVPRRDIMAVGRNYHEHAKEFHDSGFDATSGATAVPDHPIIFNKATTSVVGPGDPIPAHLDPTDSVDYEGELAVIIGKQGRGVAKADAFDYVFGYTVANDVTARNLQHRHKQWFIGKSLENLRRR